MSCKASTQTGEPDAMSTSVVVYAQDRSAGLGRRPLAPTYKPVVERGAQVILSFDVEEHHRIEAAAGLDLDPALVAHYDRRVAPPTYWLLDQLERHDIRATFFIL